jgi:hypothetical protein
MKWLRGEGEMREWGEGKRERFSLAVLGFPFS